MKKKKKQTDHEVLEELFPKEIVEEVDAIIEEVNRPERRENPTGKKLPKPWTPEWIKEQEGREK